MVIKADIIDKNISCLILFILLVFFIKHMVLKPMTAPLQPYVLSRFNLHLFFFDIKCIIFFILITSSKKHLVIYSFENSLSLNLKV